MLVTRYKGESYSKKKIMDVFGQPTIRLFGRLRETNKTHLKHLTQVRVDGRYMIYSLRLKLKIHIRNVFFLLLSHSFCLFRIIGYTTNSFIIVIIITRVIIVIASVILQQQQNSGTVDVLIHFLTILHLLHHFLHTYTGSWWINLHVFS